MDTREVRGLDLESQAPRASCPSGLLSLSAEETHCRRPSPLLVVMGAKRESNTFWLVRGPSREGAQGRGERLSQAQKPSGYSCIFF